MNDPPVAVDDAYTLEEDRSLSVVAPGLLSNDSDVDADSLSAFVASDPENGNLTLDEVGSFLYTPNSNFNGVDVFEYLLSDGVGGSDTATVTLTVRAVNDPPVAVDDVYSIDEDSTLSVGAPGVLSNDINVDGDNLSAAVASDPENGTLTLDRMGSFRYTPDENFNGVDTFEYTLSDGGGGISTATVTLTVRQANDPPLAVDDGYSIEEDDTLTVAAPGVLGNDSDVDADSLIASVASNPENGTLTLDEKGSFRYTPTKDFNGVDGFEYTLSDGNSSNATGHVKLVIKPANDQPTAQADRYAVDEDNTLNVEAPGVLGNDDDIDGDSLAVSVFSKPLRGSLTLNSDGAFSYTPMGTCCCPPGPIVRRCLSQLIPAPHWKLHRADHVSYK